MNHIAQVPIGKTFGSPFGQTQGAGNLISILLSNIVGLSAITLFGLFLFGGISIIMGAGNSDPQSVAKGKSAITAAIIGFLVVFAAYWIIQLIEAFTGFPILEPKL